MTDVVLRPLADAFLQVGVYVAVLVVVFGWLRWRLGSRLDAALVRRARWAPAVGALLGVSPGCGGAIIIVPLYVRGRVSFGTVVAALTATMGDASWVLLAAEPWLALRLHGLLLAAGLLTGYAVDAVGLDPRRGRSPVGAAPERVPVAPAVRLVPATASLHAVGGAAVAFWVLAGAGFTVSLPVTFQLLDPAAVAASLGGVDAYVAVGLAGIGSALVVFVRGGCRLADDDLSTASPQRLSHVLRHGARETSFITVWVGAAYLAWTVIEASTGFDGSALPLLGLGGVLTGALVGLVPGCALQIVFTGLFLSGGVPLPAFAANAVSQDGDALLPLLALDRRAALVATATTTVPAVLVGSLLLLL